MTGKLLSLALRNVLRNRRRTIIAATAIGIGLAAMVFTDGLMIGMSDNLIDSVTDTWLGDAQIHREGFLTTYSPELLVDSAAEVLDRLDRDPRVVASAPRVLAQGTVSSAADLRSVILVGIDPERESRVSRIDDSIVGGEFLREEGGEGILLGSKVAADLEVGLGDRVVVTISQVESGIIYQDMIRVSGIVETGTAAVDESMSFVSAGKAQEMLGLPEDGFQEIAFTLSDRRLAEQADSNFWAGYSRGGNTALGWPDLMAQLDAVLAMSDFSTLIMAVILFGLVAFGIMNAIFMSIYERIFEFGVMKAIGTRAGRIVSLVVLEAAWLAIISIALGSLVGLAATWLVAQQGIDYTGIELSGATFREPVRPVLTLQQFIFYPLWVLLLTALVGLYPAVHAARIRPALAMRRSL
ncbi:ABC transporter permease [Candidatus Fermentibacterales bacterium]|nr:ABC transporter permease [Candidatus Fermentibacterales bacterium]